MPNVIIEGIFMGVNTKTSNFDGKETTSLYIDVYQPDSDDTEKTLQIKSGDLSLLGSLTKDYILGTPFSCKASVNAYKNKAYYKLAEVLS